MNTNLSSTTTTAKFDAFVSYSNIDQTFATKIIKKLESKPWNFRCVNHERDFIGGVPVMDNIKTHLETSRCCIILLSQSFVASEWCKMEKDWMQMLSLEEPRRSIIPVVIEDCPIPESLRTVTYIKATSSLKDNWFHRLVKAMGHEVCNSCTSRPPSLATVCCEACVGTYCGSCYGKHACRPRPKLRTPSGRGQPPSPEDCPQQGSSFSNSDVDKLEEAVCVIQNVVRGQREKNVAIGTEGGLEDARRRVLDKDSGHWLTADDIDLEVQTSPRETTYRLTVNTSDVLGAGTDANVSVVLSGVNGTRSPPLHLHHSETHINPFEQSQSDVFTFRNVQWVGELERVNVWHDDTGCASAWHLQSIHIEDQSQNQGYTVHCNKWFSKQKDDKMIERELRCRPFTYDQSVNGENVEYTIIVKTGDVLGAGTDANVVITLFGSHGKSDKHPLKQARRDLFERNQIDKFRIHTASHLGDLSKVRLEHDNSGFGGAWYVDYVRVLDTASGQLTCFPCGQWLDKSKGDKKICRDIFARK